MHLSEATSNCVAANISASAMRTIATQGRDQGQTPIAIAQSIVERAMGSNPVPNADEDGEAVVVAIVRPLHDP